MTSTDVDATLKALLLKAGIIRYQPETGVSFYSIVLLAAMGGGSQVRYSPPTTLAR